MLFKLLLTHPHLLEGTKGRQNGPTCGAKWAQLSNTGWQQLCSSVLGVSLQ